MLDFLPAPDYNLACWSTHPIDKENANPMKQVPEPRQQTDAASAKPQTPTPESTPLPTTAAQVLGMQRLVGNRAVMRWVAHRRGTAPNHIQRMADWTTILPRFDRSGDEANPAKRTAADPKRPAITTTLPSQKGQAPTTTGQDVAPDSGKTDAEGKPLTGLDALTPEQRAIVDQIRSNRQQQASSDVAKKLELHVYQGRYGYYYNGVRPGKPDGTPSVLTEGLGPNPKPEAAKRHKALEALWTELRAEGGVGSINAYDSQLVTWGRGIGFKSGPIGVVMNALNKNADIRGEFLKYGIAYGGGFLVVNTETGAIETDMSALNMMMASPAMLSVFTMIAEDERYHQAVVDAQWLAIMKSAGQIPDYALDWPESSIQLVGHITHWWPAVGWGDDKHPRYSGTGGDPLAIVKTFIQAGAGAANANGAMSVRNADTARNFQVWGGGVGYKALNANFASVMLSDSQVDNDPSLSGCLVLVNGLGKSVVKGNKIEQRTFWVSPPPAKLSNAKSNAQLLAEGEFVQVYQNINGLNMQDMLREIAYTSAMGGALWIEFLMDTDARAKAGINWPRIQFAIDVVNTRQIPENIPDGLPPDQVEAAREFLKPASPSPSKKGKKKK